MRLGELSLLALSRLQESYSGQLLRRRHYLGVRAEWPLTPQPRDPATRDQGRVVFDHELKELRARLKALRSRLRSRSPTLEPAFWPISLS